MLLLHSNWILVYQNTTSSQQLKNSAALYITNKNSGHQKIGTRNQSYDGQFSLMHFYISAYLYLPKRKFNYRPPFDILRDREVYYPSILLLPFCLQHSYVTCIYVQPKTIIWFSLPMLRRGYSFAPNSFLPHELWISVRDKDEEWIFSFCSIWTWSKDNCNLLCMIVSPLWQFG